MFIAPFVLFAQNAIERQKLQTVDCYKMSIANYIKDHSTDVYKTKSGKVLLVKKATFISDYQDSASKVNVLFVKADSAKNISKLFPKNQKLTVIDLQQMLLRDLNAFIWIMPTHGEFDSKKGVLSSVEYGNLLCEYQYDYTPERNSYYYFKSANCKDQ
jgi:hypothetical protein